MSVGLGWLWGFEPGLFFSLSLLFFGFAVDVFKKGADVGQFVVVLAGFELFGVLLGFRVLLPFFFGLLLFQFFDLVFVVVVPVAVFLAGEAVLRGIAGFDGFGHFDGAAVVAELADGRAGGAAAATSCIEAHGEADSVEVGAGFLLRDTLLAHGPADLLNGHHAAVVIFQRVETEGRAGARRRSIQLLAEIAMEVAEIAVANLRLSAFASRWKDVTTFDVHGKLQGTRGQGDESPNSKFVVFS